MNQSASAEVQNRKPAKYPWLEPGRYGPFKAPINAQRRVGQRATLYFVGDDGPLIKIGIAANLERRLVSLQLGNPRLRCLAYRTMPRALDRQIERLVHEALADDAAGREWFRTALPVALKAAHPIIQRGERLYQKMLSDGVFGWY